MAIYFFYFFMTWLIIQWIIWPLFKHYKRQHSKLNNFQDWVKIPEIKKEHTANQQISKPPKLPTNLTDAQIRKMVKGLNKYRTCEKNRDLLNLVGKRAEPFLIEALNNTQAITKTYDKAPDSWFGPQNSLQFICYILAKFQSIKAIPQLAPYLNSKDENNKKCAAIAICGTGSDESIPYIPVIFSINHANTIQETIRTISETITKGDTTKEYRKTIFKYALPLMTQKFDGFSFRLHFDIAILLLNIDKQSATQYLLSDKLFSTSNRVLDSIINALNVNQVKIPRSKIHFLLEQLKPKIFGYSEETKEQFRSNLPYASIYEQVLIAYSINPDDKTLAILKEEIHSPNESVQSAATSSLNILFNIKIPFDEMIEALTNATFNNLPQAWQYYYAAYMYNYEVKNGGHAQYFVNESGDFWHLTMKALQEIGANQSAHILHKATQLFGNSGPSKNEDKRHDQLAKLSESQNDEMNHLDSEYYGLKENINSKLTLYTIKHRNIFTKKQTATS